MKKLYFLFTTILLLSVVILNSTGCKTETVIKTETIKPIIPSGDDYMTFKLDGTSRTASFVSGVSFPTSTITLTQVTGNLGTLGTTTEGLGLDLSNSSALEVKTYAINGDGTAGITYIPVGAPTAVSYHTIDEGTITITAINGDRITGTFSGTLKPVDGTPGSKIVTEGKFSSKITTVEP